MSIKGDPETAKKPTQDELLKEIEEYIKRSDKGVSIQDVAREFDITRYNANGILGILIGSGRIGVQQIGPVKVHYWKGGE